MDDPITGVNAAAVSWPRAREIYDAIAERMDLLLAEQGATLGGAVRAAMVREGQVLGDRPKSLWSIVVAGACISAGADWRKALWPAVAAECALLAADMLDDLADGDTASLPTGMSPGVALTLAAGLLTAASDAVLRSTEDGVSAETAVALGRILGSQFASATDGQARSLMLSAEEAGADVMAAYQASAAKSGPLGALVARLGARVATDDPALLDLYATYGRRLAVQSQLLNDARDAAPDAPSHKPDVRDGYGTVPLVFSRSSAAPRGLEGEALRAWEAAERQRIFQEGGIAVAFGLAQAERLHAMEALETLEGRGQPVEGLRALLH